MEENKRLKYNEEKLFNSEELQQYDEEGQKYFLGYLLRKGHNLEIRDNEIIFKDITSEDKIRDILKEYNNETREEVLRIKRETVNTVEVVGISNYRNSIEKELKELDKDKNKEKRER